MTLGRGQGKGRERAAWESGGGPQNRQRAPKTAHQTNRETPSQRAFANQANVPNLRSQGTAHIPSMARLVP